MQLAAQSAVLTRIEHRLNQDTTVENAMDLNEMPLYPATTEEELRTLEASLENSIIFAALVKELGQIGGCDISTTTKRVMKRLLHDSVAVLYSYTGRKGKRRAAELNIVRLVFAAVRTTCKATDAEISHVTGDWLRFANARLTASKNKVPRPAY
ncbi:hypothetical protein MRX96_038427 [Rhipicephalus microplus]